MAKKYYCPGIDKINQLVETPASKEKTEFRRFFITSAIAAIAAIAAIIAAVVTIMAR
ncbi:MAG: hypothetical protein FWF49_04970 [Oscillospiraceae bacterium]|nr:hypothetical protein [Oscillospiraceae bacterium]